MDLSLSLVHQINKLWSQLVQTSEANGTSRVVCKHCQCLQGRLSGQLIVESFSKDVDHLINFNIREDFMCNVQKLGHANNAALLHFLIDVLLLQFLENDVVQILDNISEIKSQLSFKILKLNDKHSCDSKGLTHNS